jgi:hypothetical protein
VAEYVLEFFRQTAAIFGLCRPVCSLFEHLGARFDFDRQDLDHPEPHRSSNSARGIVFFSGVQLMILGLIGEYAGRLYLYQTGTPQYIVRYVIHADTQSDASIAPGQQ